MYVIIYDDHRTFIFHKAPGDIFANKFLLLYALEDVKIFNW